jgi:geranyl-CoA carboxylase alpha subunit
MPKTRPRISCRRPVACAGNRPRGGARIDHGLLEGQQISPFYDPMLGKIIAHGATREEARRKLLRAVQDTVLLGVQSNQRLLASLLQHPHFISGEFSTGFIASTSATILPAHTSPPPRNWRLPPRCFIRPAPIASRPAYRLAQQRQCAAPVSPGLEDQTWTVELKAMPGRPTGTDATRSLDLTIIECDGRWATLEIDGIRRRHAYRLAATNSGSPARAV